MRVANISVDMWNNKYVVVSEFNGMTLITNKEFNTYYEAIEEAHKQVGRELIRLGIKR